MAEAKEGLEVVLDGEPAFVGSGTTVAAALTNQGIWSFRKSLSGEARGPLCAMGICHECRVTIDGVPNRRSCLELCSSGMKVQPGGKGAPGSAGVPPAQTWEGNVAIVGAGPAGVAAACRAAEAGASVAVLDEGFAPGGQIYRHLPGQAVPPRLAPWLERLARSGARVFAQTAVFDARAVGSDLEIDAVRQTENGEQRLAIKARRLVLATGARELFLPFPGWTLPGVMGAGGLQALVKTGFDVSGKEVVVAGSGPLLLPVAATLAKAGARLRLVAEQAPFPALARFGLGLLSRPGKLLEALELRRGFTGAPYLTGSWVSAAHAGGSGQLSGVTVVSGGRTSNLSCDLLAVAYGLVPGTELARLLGCRIEGRAVTVDGRQETSVPGIFAAGEPCGIAGVDAAFTEGEIAGLAAAERLPAEEHRRLSAGRRAARRFAAALSRAFALRPELKSLAAADTVVCRCEDVRRAAFDPAWSAREAKLAARAGMGACQGRVCGPALSFLFGWEADAVRPPLQPVAFAHLLPLEESQ